MVNFTDATTAYGDHHHNHDTSTNTYFVPPQPTVKRETKITATTSSSSLSSSKPCISTVRDDDWKSLANSITYLFHKKQLQKLELDILNEKVRNVHHSSARKGEAIVECYKDSILKKGMIVLREAIKEKKGNELLDRLADVWTSFYKNILPMLLAIFYPIQEQGTTIRSVTLVGFRDMVLLKTKIADALEMAGGGGTNTTTKASPEIKQMLLVLASVHDSNPPTENYLKLEQLVARVVSPYLGTGGLFTLQQTIHHHSLAKQNSTDYQKLMGSPRERKLSISQVLKEEVTRKFRRSGSLTGGGGSSGQANNNTSSISSETNNNLRESSFKRRFKLGDYSSSSSSSMTTAAATKIVVVPPTPTTTNNNTAAATEHLKTTTTANGNDNDDDMMAYLEERKQRWKNRDEMLVSESLLE